MLRLREELLGRPPLGDAARIEEAHPVRDVTACSNRVNVADRRPGGRGGRVMGPWLWSWRGELNP